MLQLTEHFWLEELCVSQTAARECLQNAPSRDVQNVMATVLAPGLEAVRDLLGGKPLLISSGYRSPDVNKADHGADNSAHLYGFAADFICPAFGLPLDVCKALDASPLKFDQVIQEGTWTHVSFDPRMRRQTLTAIFKPGQKTEYMPGLF